MKTSGNALLRGLFALCLAFPALAQFDTAEVLGTVRDKSDSAVAGATVTLSNQGTGIRATAQTSADGSYAFSNVKIGVYSISAEATGFSRAAAKDITINVNARQRVDLFLEVGTVTETIEEIGRAHV